MKVWVARYEVSNSSGSVTHSGLEVFFDGPTAEGWREALLKKTGALGYKASCVLHQFSSDEIPKSPETIITEVWNTAVGLAWNG